MKNPIQSIKNAFYSLRQETIRAMSGETRDYNHECGYPDAISAQQYRNFYNRWGVATRAVNIWPKECWQTTPVITENQDTELTAFEKAFNDLEQEFNLFQYLGRIDVLSGIGRYGALLLGLSDNKALIEPVDGNAHKLLYLRTFDESICAINAVEDDTKNARYGKPIIYGATLVGADGNAGTSVSIHHSRMVHIADNRECDETYGTPRLQAIYNHVHDIRKIGGGSAEMFWKGGFPGLGITVDPNLDMDQVTLDTDTLKDEIEAYSEGLKRYMILTGASANSLMPNVADPRGHFEIIMKLIAISLGVPQRIFLGSEAAKLASTQDKKAWQMRVSHRQETYLSPLVIRPVIDTLIEYGVLPEPTDGYDIKWPVLDSPSEEDEATVAKIRTEAIAQYVSSGAHALIPPNLYFKLIHKFDEAEIEAIEDELVDYEAEIDEDDLESSTED